MSTRTLPGPLRPSAPPRHTSRALVVVADDDRTAPATTTGPTTGPPVPEWVTRWSRRAGVELRRHPGSGPAAASAAARLDDRVLVLRPATPAPPGGLPRIVAAVRRLPEDDAVVADAAACAARIGGRLTIVHAVPRSFAERSVGLAGALTHGRQLLETAATRATAYEPGVRVDCQLLRVRPHELVGEALHADLLVVGGSRPDRAAGPGLVAHSALYHAPCPVLLTPR